MLQHAVDEVHGRSPFDCREAKPARRMEMDAVRGRKAEPSGDRWRAAQLRRRLAKRPTKRADERLKRAIARVEGNLRHRRLGGGELVGRSFEKQPTTKRDRRLADPRCQQPVEVIGRQIRSLGERRAVHPLLLEAGDHRVKDLAEPVGSGRHRHGRDARGG